MGTTLHVDYFRECFKIDLAETPSVLIPEFGAFKQVKWKELVRIVCSSPTNTLFGQEGESHKTC